MPGPKPMGPNVKTTVRVLGKRADEFEALCHLLRRRPFQLAADLVQLVAARAQERAMTSRRVRRGGLRVLDGGGQ